jgi:hypothetical protein
MTNSCRYPIVGLFLLILSCGQIESQTLSERSGASRDTLLKIEAKRGKGFNYSYYLFLPSGSRNNNPTYLLVEPNNSGKPTDDIAFQDADARFTAETSSVGRSISKKLGLPLLVPVFPRPEKIWKTYTHALDRDAMLITEGDMKRIDLQLIAMIDDARERLKRLGIAADEKVMLNGFSASGTFANRFTLLHPARVKAVASGGINGIAMLPVKELDKTALEYPLGIVDFETITGHPFDVREYRTVPQYIYMGAKDSNDASLFKDSYDDSERTIIHTLIGKVMMPDRFKKCESIYQEQHINARFVVYPDVGHGVNKQIIVDLCRFFRSEMERKKRE